jgi:citrate lyase beta subunit
MSAFDNELTALAPMLGDDWAKRVAAERAEERAGMTALRARLLDAARAAGAVTITARYEGGGDSGVMHEVAAEPKDADDRLAGASVACPRQVYNAEAKAYRTEMVATPFTAAVTDFLSWMVTEQNGNWWDGSIETSGEVVWHVADDPDRIAGEHNVVVRSSEWSEWEEEPEDPGEGADSGADGAAPRMTAEG